MHSWQGGGVDFDDNDDNGSNGGTSLDQRTGSENGTGPDWTGQDRTRLGVTALHRVT